MQKLHTQRAASVFADCAAEHPGKVVCNVFEGLELEVELLSGCGAGSSAMGHLLHLQDGLTDLVDAAGLVAAADGNLVDEQLDLGRLGRDGTDGCGDLVYLMFADVRLGDAVVDKDCGFLCGLRAALG